MPANGPRWRRIVVGWTLVIEALIAAVMIEAGLWRDGVPDMSWAAVPPTLVMVGALAAFLIWPMLVLTWWERGRD